MINAVLIRYEGVIAQVAPSLIEYVGELAAPASVDLASAVAGYYRAGRPWESYMDDVLVRAGVDPKIVLDIIGRTRAALSRPEGWRLYEDVPVALNWMAQREIPTAIVGDWPVEVAGLLDHAGVRCNAVFLYRDGTFSDVLSHEMSRLGLPVPAGLYLVHVTARSDDGGQTSAMATVALR